MSGSSVDCATRPLASSPDTILTGRTSPRLASPLSVSTTRQRAVERNPSFPGSRVSSPTSSATTTCRASSALVVSVARPFIASSASTGSKPRAFNAVISVAVCP